VLTRVRGMNGFVSPRLGIRFDLSGPRLVVRYPDGQLFRTFEELAAAHNRLAELTRKALRQQATPEEMQELLRLIEPGTPPGSAP
jgi:hypothetical protein